jgi:hypothetical protein
MVGGELSLSFHSLCRHALHYIFTFIGYFQGSSQGPKQKSSPSTLIHFLIKLLKEEKANRREEK